MVTQVEPKEDEKKTADIDPMPPMKMEHHDTHTNSNNKIPMQSNMTAPSKSLSPVNPSSSNRPAPIITNSTPNRPPSTTSIHSASSNGASARTTATSRRGGRTRARSPPAMVNRPGSRGPNDNYGPMNERGGPVPPPPSPANPSAAAAAAAAAAKSLSNNRSVPPPSSWQYEPTQGRRPHPDSTRYPPRSRHPSSQPGPTSSSSTTVRHSGYYDHRGWAPEEDGRPSSRSGSRYGQPPRRGEDHYGYRGGGEQPGYAYRGRPSRGDPYHQQYNNEEYDRRYPNHAQRIYEERLSRRGGDRPPHYAGEHYRRDHHPRDTRDEAYYKGGPETGAPSVKRTTRVIGTATPIHVPRASEQGVPSRGTAASVFRGRPGADLGPPSRGNPPVEESGPQKILMSLRTPSTSFEEKTPVTKPGNRRSSTNNDSSNQTLSPQEPPQIQHSHHQSATDANLFFEPTRSPKSTSSGPPNPTSSLDMAPSFSLFNQSFDSIGDTQFFNVGGPLDSVSFGAALGGSDDNVADLQGGSSFTQTLLAGSGSGALTGTFGMSPNNSFGNGPSSRGSNMMVLGGQQDGSSSPSQVLDMYRSSGSLNPKEDSNLRLGGTNIGASSAGNSYSSPFHQRAPPPGHIRGNSLGESPDGTPSFYVFLKKNKAAFKECSFLLPGLKTALLGSPPTIKKEDKQDTPKRNTRSQFGEPTPRDSAVAMRRVASAVCAFGGTFTGDRAPQRPQKEEEKPTPASTQSIFREKGDTPAVTPSSSTSSPPNGHSVRPKSKYDEMLPGRYYENDNRLSWEFEERPPIEEATTKEDEEESSGVKKGSGDGDDSNADSSGASGDKEDGDDSGDSSVQEDGDDSKKEPGQADQPKMRYRCKLCGQPKQNHTCPYQQSLARSIGTMIYPAVNAFTSAEPGVLAPALSEMNNFIGSGESVSSAETSPSRPTPERIRMLNAVVASSSAQVTPESLRTARASNSPISAVSIATPQRSRTPGSGGRRLMRNQNRYVGVGTPGSVRKKRSHAQMDEQGDLLFVEATELKPEQFRIITSSKALSKPGAFTYPSLPLPYAQRKRLSDNLFSLSKEVPHLTDECAAVLREARERDMWDLAVAELMTQVVIVVHCPDGDTQFDGLRRYLLTLGISC